jgi:hypothetical protein
MKDESEFRTDFIKALKKHCAIWYMSSMTRAGIPDVHLLSDGNCAWLELKFAPSLPKSPRAETLKHSKRKDTRPWE